MKRFLVSPVRGITDEERKFLAQRVAEWEGAGDVVHWPARDTNQNDPSGGLQICRDNGEAILLADEVCVYWNTRSEGSLFDFGMTFMLFLISGKKIILINPEMVEQMVEDETRRGVIKSFNKVILALHKKHIRTT